MTLYSHDLSIARCHLEKQSGQSGAGSGTGGGRGGEGGERFWLPGLFFGRSSGEEEPHETPPVAALPSIVQGVTKQHRISNGWRHFFRLKADEQDNDSRDSFSEQEEDIVSHVEDPEPPAFNHPSCVLSDIRLEINDIHEAIKNHDQWVHDAFAMRRDIDDLWSAIWEHEDWMANVFGVVKQMQANEDFLRKKVNVLAKEITELRRQVVPVADSSGPDLNVDSACGVVVRSQADAHSATVAEECVGNLMMNDTTIRDSFGHCDLEVQGLSYPVQGSNSLITRSRSFPSLKVGNDNDHRASLAAGTHGSCAIDTMKDESTRKFSASPADNLKANASDENKADLANASAALVSQNDSMRLVADIPFLRSTDSNDIACSRRRVEHYDLRLPDTNATRQDIDDLLLTMWEHEGWMANILGAVKAKEETFAKEMADLWQQIGKNQGLVRIMVPDYNLSFGSADPASSGGSA